MASKAGRLATSVARGSNSRVARLSQRRCQHTEAEELGKPLRTPQDWTEFQMHRAERMTLKDTFAGFGSSQNSKNTWQPRHGLHRPQSQATLSALLASGAHFGHASSRMNPNFMPYAYGTRAGITVIDLDQTLPMLRRAANVVRAVARNGGQILFIGTRPDLRPIVQKAAERVGGQGYYVGDRWLPGTLTNKAQVLGQDTVQTTKAVPDLVVLLNPLANMNAIRECAIEHVPTIGLIDSNADPRIVMYPIPANDESTRTAELVGGLLSVAAREGAQIYEMESQRTMEREQNKANQRARYARHAD